MTITREIAGNIVEIELTDHELTKAFYEKRHENDIEWISWLLNDYGYDTDRMEDRQLEDIADRYRSCLQDGDDLGELEHSVFEDIIEEFDCPLLEDDEEVV